MQMRLNCLTGGKRRNESAFTIVEVVIAAAILLIGYVSLYSAMGFGWSAIQSSKENLRATEIMTEKMEQIRLYNWDQVTNTTTYVNPTPFAQYFDPSDHGKVPVYGCRVLLDNV